MIFKIFAKMAAFLVIASPCFSQEEREPQSRRRSDQQQERPATPSRNENPRVGNWLVTRSCILSYVGRSLLNQSTPPLIGQEPITINFSREGSPVGIAFRTSFNYGSNNIEHYQIDGCSFLMFKQVLSNSSIYSHTSTGEDSSVVVPQIVDAMIRLEAARLPLVLPIFPSQVRGDLSGLALAVNQVRQCVRRT